MKPFIEGIVHGLKMGVGACFIFLLLAIATRMVQVSWKHFHEAIVGSDGKMSPKELGIPVTGVCLLLMVTAGPVFSYEYSDPQFGLIAGAFLASIGLYIYGEFKKNGNGKDKNNSDRLPTQGDSGEHPNL